MCATCICSYVLYVHIDKLCATVFLAGIVLDFFMNQNEQAFKNMEIETQIK